MAHLRQTWEELLGSDSRASDGYYIVSEFQSVHRRRRYPESLILAYDQTIQSIVTAIQQPIRYAGVGQYSIFARPQTWKKLQSTPHIVGIPGTQPKDKCLVVNSDLWNSFIDLSLWIDALCIHEWSLFTENISGVNRGVIYSLLTEHPNNRRPLTWERNQIEILMMEGEVFECIWTGKKLTRENYDLDHVIPLSVYPINEMWNLVPADAKFNRHKKRNRMPGKAALELARPRMLRSYENYIHSESLAEALQKDALMRFDGKVKTTNFSESLVTCAVGFIQTVAKARNVASF